MTTEIALTLIIILAALVLFATEKLRVDLVALLVLLSVGLTRLVDPEEIFEGFANPAVITVWAVYMVSAGLFQTGVADAMGRGILRLAGDREPRLIATIMVTCGVISAFMNNVGATAMLMPAVVGISRRTKIAVSKLLMPLSFSSLLGGKMTLIGTPANILAMGILAERGLSTIGFFGFTPMGLVVLTTGVLYMVLIGRHLLPVREGAQGRQDVYRLRQYVTEVRISDTSPLAGKTLLESRLGQDYDLTVLAIERDGVSQAPIRRDTVVQSADLLTVEGSADDLMAAREALGITIEAERKLDVERLEPGNVQLIEATLAPRSGLVGRTLREVRFRDRYGFTALAIWRHGEAITEKLRDIPLQFGDALLLQGSRHRVRALQEGTDFLVLEPFEVEQLQREKAPIAIAALVLAIGLVVFVDFHISMAMVIAAVIMILTGCLSIEEAHESIDWRTVFLVAGMLPLGMAMEATGTAQYLADIMLKALGDYGPIALLAGIYLLAALITQAMSNAAAMVLIVPIAVDTALSLGANHLTFTMAVVIGAATSFLSPVGHKANVLVFGPGGYRFFDYARVGALLTLALLIVSMIFLPLFWPLFP
ncbi:MAG TPA: SLC13 family permease [Anaerolineae bacterium]|nr:SLC13 family permease [Anaerolineae bacterium]